MMNIKKYLLLVVAIIASVQVNLVAQEEEEKKAWEAGGAVGIDFAQMLFVNPKFGAGQDKIGVGGNLSLFAKYKKNRITWDNFAGITFGIQRIGTFRKEIPFQKTADELRIASKFAYGLTDKSSFGAALDVLFLSQITPTYEGNILSPLPDTMGTTGRPIAQFFSPATITISPGISFEKKTKFGNFKALLSPASLKMILVGSDTIARLGLHGNPFSQGVTEQEFRDNWNTNSDGVLWNGGHYARNYIQFGATLKAGYSHKFFPYKEGDKEKHRLVFNTTINLYSKIF